MRSRAGGGAVDVEYRDVCLRRVKRPIEMDTHYTASEETTWTLIPEFRDIRLSNVRVQEGGRVILDGYDAKRPLRMAWDNVTFDAPATFKLRAQNLELTKGPGPVNLAVQGVNVRTSGTANDAPANACVGKFVPMPATVASASIGG